MHTWVVLVDEQREPLLALNAADFTRAALFGPRPFDPYGHCHRPLVVRDGKTTLGDVIRQLKRRTVRDDAVIDDDVVLIWLDEPRIVTGSDLLARLLTGIGSSKYA